MKNVKKTIVYLLLAVGAVIMVFPFVWMILSSLKTAAEVNTTPLSRQPYLRKLQIRL